MIETASSHTFTTLKTESKDWSRFLSRVIRDNDNSDSCGSWTIHAAPDTDWCLEFRRRIKAKSIGDSDRDVTVRTDLKVRIDYKPKLVKSFEDSSPVELRECRGVYVMSHDILVACTLLRNPEPRVIVTGSAGSAHSSRFGLSFYSLNISWKSIRYHHVSLGETVAINGRCICSGPVVIR